MGKMITCIVVWRSSNDDRSYRGNVIDVKKHTEQGHETYIRTQLTLNTINIYMYM